MNELRFDGEVAIVTGGGRGLGRAYAHLLASRGARVVVNDAGPASDGSGADRGPAQAVVDELLAEGGEAVADAHSVVDRAGEIVALALDTWGRLDVVVNNAGIAGGGSLDVLDDAEHDLMFATHYGGTRNVTRAAWPHLAGTRGRVVTTSSSSVFGLSGTSHYISAKAAIIGFTRAAAQEGAGAGIRVNAIMPTAFTRLTAQIPDPTFTAYLDEHFQPDRVAPFVAWLCHRDVPVTGELFSVGGGRVARVVLGEAPGVVTPEPSPETYVGRLEELMSIDGLVVPKDAMEEVFLFVAALEAPRLDQVKMIWPPAAIS